MRRCLTSSCMLLAWVAQPLVISKWALAASMKPHCIGKTSAACTGLPSRSDLRAAIFLMREAADLLRETPLA